MAATCIPVLNYIAFLVLYVICFYAISRDNTKIVGYAILFVIHTAFILFIMNNLFKVISIDLKYKSGAGNDFLTYFALLAVVVSLKLHFVSFVLILMTLTYLRQKYNSKDGTSMKLDNENANLLQKFNTYMYVIFGLCGVLLGMFFYDLSGFTFINIKFLNTKDISSFLNEPELSGIGVILFPFLALLFSIAAIYMSYLQFLNANAVSRIYSRDITKKDLTVNKVVNLSAFSTDLTSGKPGSSAEFNPMPTSCSLTSTSSSTSTEPSSCDIPNSNIMDSNSHAAYLF
jgi:hypothetical protein